MPSNGAWDGPIAGDSEDAAVRRRTITSFLLGFLLTLAATVIYGVHDDPCKRIELRAWRLQWDASQRDRRPNDVASLRKRRQRWRFGSAEAAHIVARVVPAAIPASGISLTVSGSFADDADGAALLTDESVVKHLQGALRVPQVAISHRHSHPNCTVDCVGLLPQPMTARDELPLTLTLRGPHHEQDASAAGGGDGMPSQGTRQRVALECLGVHPANGSGSAFACCGGVPRAGCAVVLGSNVVQLRQRCAFMTSSAPALESTLQGYQPIASLQASRPTTETRRAVSVSEAVQKWCGPLDGADADAEGLLAARFVLLELAARDNVTGPVERAADLTARLELATAALAIPVGLSGSGNIMCVGIDCVNLLDSMSSTISATNEADAWTTLRGLESSAAQMASERDRLRAWRDARAAGTWGRLRAQLLAAWQWRESIRAAADLWLRYGRRQDVAAALLGTLL